MARSPTPEERYARIVDVLAGVTQGPAVSESKKRGFGSSGQLQAGGKIFAMLARGNLVVKLPRQRVDELVEAGAGERFDPRRDGRLMKEWLVVEPGSQEEWLPLATEAMRFVSSNR